MKRMGFLQRLGLGRASPPPKINSLLQMISRRAERLDPHQQAETFVSLGGIEHTLLNPDNRVIFGRRGTGKTHVMSFVADSAKKKGQMALSLDLRTIGSNSYIYTDESLSLQERATRLLRDFISALHDALLDQVTEPKSGYDVNRLSPLIDRLGNAVKEVVVGESIERKDVDQGSTESTVGGQGSAKASVFHGSLELRGKGEYKRAGGTSTEITQRGHPRLSVNIGEVSRALSEFVDRANTRIWVLIDEWSTLPEPLQPYLADFIKRTLFPISRYSVQIAAIEQRSNFREGQGTEITGLELGSDVFADINLDDHLVFENSPQRAITFFKEMLYRHLVAVTESASPARDSDDFVRTAFTQGSVFRELVRASEGVPRDAINILQIAATRAQEERISIPHIRDSAKDWYERDKATYVNSNTGANSLLHWIINKVIGERKAKAFMVRSGVKDEILERLFDERILHVAKKSYSTKDDPGIRYTVWKIDYGCYVDLINTSRAPTGFLFEGIETDDDWMLTVPEDDFRAIRRAILDPGEFHTRTEPSATQVTPF
jgi:hypothetical protein